MDWELSCDLLWPDILLRVWGSLMCSGGLSVHCGCDSVRYVVCIQEVAIFLTVCWSPPKNAAISISIIQSTLDVHRFPLSVVFVGSSSAYTWGGVWLFVCNRLLLVLCCLPFLYPYVPQSAFELCV